MARRSWPCPRNCKFGFSAWSNVFLAHPSGRIFSFYRPVYAAEFDNGNGLPDVCFRKKGLVPPDVISVFVPVCTVAVAGSSRDCTVAYCFERHTEYKQEPRLALHSFGVWVRHQTAVTMAS